jgi:peptidoglycan/LPS O-acetylase OafA/YrhL
MRRTHWTLLVVVILASIYGAWIFLYSSPERSTSLPQYVAILFVGGLILLGGELAAEKIGGSDKVSDPLGKRVLTLGLLLASGAGFLAVLYWVIGQA